MIERRLLPALVVALASLASGCRIVAAGVVTVAAAVGLAGYVVYKTGDAAVTGVGKAGDAVASGSKSATTFFYANGELKVSHPFDVRTVWLTSSLALRKAGFSDIKGAFDALSGELTAKTREGVDLTLKMRRQDALGTELRIRVGVKGDLKAAEFIDSLILRELPVRTPAPAQEVKQ